MRRIKTLIQAILIGVGTLSPALAESLEILGDASFAPYSFVEAGRVQGIDVDQVREAADRAGMDITIRLVPFKRMLALVEAGKAPMGFAAFVTPERQAFAYYTETPLHRSEMSVFTRTGEDFTYRRLVDLAGETVLINVGFSISDDFDDFVKKKRIRVREVRDTSAGIKYLLRGKARFYVGNRITTLYQLKLEQRLEDILSLPNPLTQGRGAYLIISKRFDRAIEMRDAFNRALAEMLEDGTTERILAHYTR